MNFWNSIKEQSAAALEVVSKDLQEFTVTVSTDTAAYLQGESSDNVQNEKGEVAEEEKSSSADTTYDLPGARATRRLAERSSKILLLL